MIFCFTTAAIPFGIFTPGLVLGTLLGRLFSEILSLFFTFESSKTIFALCGTAAFISSLTKTFSGTIIVLEMTKNFSLLLP